MVISLTKGNLRYRSTPGYLAWRTAPITSAVSIPYLTRLTNPPKGTARVLFPQIGNLHSLTVDILRADYRRQVLSERYGDTARIRRSPDLSLGDLLHKNGVFVSQSEDLECVMECNALMTLISLLVFPPHISCSNTLHCHG